MSCATTTPQSGSASPTPVLDARARPGPARVTALATALIEALVIERAGHRTTLVATAALPEVADATRHADAWLVDEFAAALAAAGVTDETARAVLARSALLLIGDWAVRLEDATSAERATCAAVLARMLAPISPLPPRLRGERPGEGRATRRRTADGRWNLAPQPEFVATITPARVPNPGAPDGPAAPAVRPPSWWPS